MTERYRFFDGASYSEANFAEVMKRVVPTGILWDQLNQAKIAPVNSTTVSVDTGEAFVEGFWYQNDTLLNVAIASNASGSDRNDIVVLKMDASANTITAQVHQGVAGAGDPTLIQIAGATWEMPLARVIAKASAGGVGAITDLRTYTYQTQTSGNFAEPAQGRQNHLRNPVQLINQRGLTSLTGASTSTLVDMWRANCNTSKYNTVRTANTTLTPGQAGGNVPFIVGHTATGGGAVAAGDFAGVGQRIEGYDWNKLYGQPLVVSWWDFSSVDATYALSLRSGGSDRAFVHPYSVPAGLWTFCWARIPAISPLSGTWNFTNGFAALLEWWTAVGSTLQTSSADSWQTGTLVGHTSMTNNLLTNGHVHQIAAPKLEIGYMPSRFVMPDFLQDQQACLRRLWRITLASANGRFTNRSGVAVSTTDVQFNFAPKVLMRDDPSLAIKDITHMRVDVVANKTLTSMSINPLNGPDNFLVTASGISPATTGGLVLELFGSTAGDWIEFAAEP